jgi:F-type H+-transporting ATPase subunit delta
MASVASTYAQALADVVVEKRLDGAGTAQQLRALRALLARHEELRRVWENPSVPAEQKRAVLDAIALREGISSPVRNFVAVLIDHQRISMFDVILREFEHELDARLGFAEAQITTARELGEAEKRALEEQVERVTGKRVRAQYVRDASLLGGAVVKVGSTIYDGSVLGQLHRIREQITGGSS